MSDKPTTIATKATLEFGGLPVVGKLLTVVNKEKATSLRTLCPTCLEADRSTGVPISQFSECPEGHGPFTKDQLPDRGRQCGETIVPLTAEDLAAIKGAEEAEKLTMSLTVHPASQVLALNRPTGVVYAFDPGPGKHGWVGVLLDIIADGELAFLGQMRVKSADRLFRLQRAPHGIELVEIARPADVFAFEAREYPYEPKIMDMAMQIAEALTTDYDPATYANRAAERLDAIVAAKIAADGDLATVVALPTAVAPAPGLDLEAQLAASLAAIRARKAVA